MGLEKNTNMRMLSRRLKLKNGGLSVTRLGQNVSSEEFFETLKKMQQIPDGTREYYIHEAKPEEDSEENMRPIIEKLVQQGDSQDKKLYVFDLSFLRKENLNHISKYFGVFNAEDGYGSQIGQKNGNLLVMVSDEAEIWRMIGVYSDFMTRATSFDIIP